jgi:16S rRNA (guanine527-N7)-methyltransferase
VLCEYCLPYVKVGGMLVALKGPDLAEEYADARHAIEVLGGGEPTLTEYALPGGDGRTLVVIPKIAPTPKKYPRQRVKLNEKPL